jgi:glutamate--cysteine ligase
MSTRQDQGASATIASRDDLIAYMAAGGKPPADWRIGTEHEKFGFHTADLSPLPYDGPVGIRAVLDQLVARYGWQPVLEGDNVIALKPAFGQPGGTVSLEPGGQLELSGAAVETVHETAAEMAEHVAQVNAIGADLGIGWLGLGFSPLWTRAQTPVMPKGRYGIMTAYMPKVGTMGLDMMYRSCTVQTNLDFRDEADMVKKLRVSLALQPVVTAIFACSPFTEGKPNGYRTFRSEVWLDTDRARTGMLPFAFEPGMGFERYVDYALDVPMYFVYRDGRYLDASGKSFRDFMAGKLDVLPGEIPTLDDWADHLSTIFPEVRLKRFLEMRGADAGPASRISEVPALWVGLLYNDEALDAAWQLVKDWTAEQRQALRDAIPKQALAAPIASRDTLAVARDVLAIAQRGLQARHRLSADGQDETLHLAGVERILDRGTTDAEVLLEKFHGAWREDIAPVFRDSAY